MGPAELLQAAKVARLYYVDDRTKVEIADELGISRYQVARILKRARDEGLVRIQIAPAGNLDPDLSDRLCTHLDLESCVVVKSPATPDAMREAIGVAAAAVLTETVTESDTLGIAWGRSVSSMVGALTSLAPCDIVQMTGVSGEFGQTSVDVLRRISEIARGHAYPIYAPMLMQNAAAARALRQHPMIAKAVAKYGSITKAVVAIGSWDPQGSQVYAVLPQADTDALAALGVVAEVCAIPLDATGRPVKTALTDRLVSIGFEELRAIPETIAVAGGKSKAPAVRAVARSSLMTALVTDVTCARALLAHDG